MAAQFSSLKLTEESHQRLSEPSTSLSAKGKSLLLLADDVSLAAVNLTCGNALVCDRYIKGIVKDIVHDPGRGAPLAKVVFRD